MAAETDTLESEEQKPWALQQLPPFPAVGLQLLSLLDNPDVPLKKVVDLLRLDPALSAELLRLANSALYGFPERIDSVRHAVIVLGSENVKRLALTVALNKFAAGFLRHENLRLCWDHVVAAALVSEELALALNIPKDRAYTAGLLHDIGRLALLACYPVEYGNALFTASEQELDPLECERRLFDIDHCAAGRWLAGHWRLPPDFVCCIARHHDTGPLADPLTSLVRAACRTADCLGFSALQAPPAGTIPEILSELPLPNAALTESALEAFAERIRQALWAIDPTQRINA